MTLIPIIKKTYLKHPILFLEQDDENDNKNNKDKDIDKDNNIDKDKDKEKNKDKNISQLISEKEIDVHMFNNNSIFNK